MITTNGMVCRLDQGTPNCIYVCGADDLCLKAVQSNVVGYY